MKEREREREAVLPKSQPCQPWPEGMGEGRPTSPGLRIRKSTKRRCCFLSSFLSVSSVFVGPGDSGPRGVPTKVFREILKHRRPLATLSPPCLPPHGPVSAPVLSARSARAQIFLRENFLLCFLNRPGGRRKTLTSGRGVARRRLEIRVCSL